MKTLWNVMVVFGLVFGMVACEQDIVDTSLDLEGDIVAKSKSMSGNKPKVTGSVEFEWKGGSKGGNAEALRSFIEFNAHEGFGKFSDKGQIIYSVYNMDGALHREIRAAVIDVEIRYSDNKAWLIGEVIFDSKSYNGSDDEHGSGCSGENHDTEEHETESDDSTEHDGGCSHETTDEGGCGDGESEDEHSSGGGTKGNTLSGKSSRVGQLIAMKVHDVGTPGTNGDGITWKWFDPEATFVPSSENILLWPHLCKKEIIDGNIVVHKI